MIKLTVGRCWSAEKRNILLQYEASETGQKANQGKLRERNDRNKENKNE